jgi:hypothetical protein
MLRLSHVAAAALVTFAGSLAACTSDDISETGNWRLTRTVDLQPAGCPTMTVADLHVVIDPTQSPMLFGRTQQLFDDGQPYEGGPTMKFTTRENVFGAARPVPILIHHELTLQGAQWHGTAFADGDGSINTCHYTVTLVGTRE